MSTKTSAPRRLHRPADPEPFLPMEHPRALLRPVRHWTPRRKELLLRAIVDGVVARTDACRAHNISAAELDEWARGFIASHKTENLQATRRVPQS